MVSVAGDASLAAIGLRVFRLSGSQPAECRNIVRREGETLALFESVALASRRSVVKLGNSTLSARQCCL